MPFHINRLVPSKQYLNLKYLFTVFTVFVILLNSVGLIRQVIKIREQRKLVPFYFSGFKFSGLEDIFQGVSYAGYYTDKDLLVKQNAAEFSQAQYILAPTILTLNNTDQELILFNCSSEKAAFDKIKEIHAVPLKKNAFGIILAGKAK